MKFINTKADVKKYRKLKAIRNFLVCIPLIIALSASIVLLTVVFDDFNPFLILYVAGPIFLICGIVSIIIGVYCMRKKLLKVKPTAREDFSSNMAVCDKCGRYFAFSELNWRGTVSSGKTTYGERDTTTTYQHGVSIKSVCPRCKTEKNGYFETWASSYKTVQVNHLGTDKYSYETTHYDSRGSSQDTAEQRARSQYNSDLLTAQCKIGEYLSLGYVIVNDEDIEAQTTQGEIFYDLFLFGVTENAEKVAEIIKEWSFCSDGEALQMARIGGIVIEYLSDSDADEAVAQFESVGARVEKQKR